MPIQIETLQVRRDDSNELRDHVKTFHYLHRWPHPGSLPFGYALIVNGQRYAPDQRLWGLVVMKHPQHNRQHGLFGYEGLPTYWQVLDLARVWINPLLQGSEDRTYINRNGTLVSYNPNVFSRMVSRVINRVQWDWLDHHPPRFADQPYHITLIISYAQLEHHDGTGYRASSFRRIGLTDDKLKDLYVRHLKAPYKSWSPPTQAVQLNLWGDE